MEIRVKENNGTKVLEAEGRIDTTTAPDFEKRLMEELIGTEKLCIDMEKVEYVSSAGLRVFLNGQKYCNKNGVEMCLVHVADIIMEVFEITGFVDILTIE